MKNYDYLEKLLNQLLASMVDSFDRKESAEVQYFIDAGEYGLALETFLDIINEESKLVSIDVYLLAKETAVAMMLGEKIVEDKIGNFVNEN